MNVPIGLIDRMGWWHQPPIWIMLMSLLAWSPAMAAGLKPPPPNPDDPVNYIEWVNETLGGHVRDNAYDVYVAAFAQLRPREGQIDFGPTLEGPWSDSKEVSDWLTANRTALELFREAAAKRECYVPLNYPRQTGNPKHDHFLINAMLPSLSSYRLMAKGLVAEGFRAWKDGDHQRLWENSLTLIRSAQHLQNNCSTLIQRLVGTAVAAQGYESLSKAFALSDDPDSLARKILPKLKAADPVSQPFSEACKLERLISWDLCQRIFIRGKRSGEWSVDEWFVDPGLTASAKSHRKSVHTLREQLTRIGFQKTLRAFDRYYDAVDTWNEAPYHTVAERSDQLDRLVTESGNPLVMALAPTWTRARILDERIAAKRRATHLIVHLFAHRAQTGKFPRSLDELDAPDLDELRIDPFSGTDFVYRKRRWGFRLYSVAENRRDDGGKDEPNWKDGDRVFWPPGK